MNSEPEKEMTGRMFSFRFAHPGLECDLQRVQLPVTVDAVTGNESIMI